MFPDTSIVRKSAPPYRRGIAIAVMAVACALLIGAAGASPPREFHVRPDGGTSKQCNGRVNQSLAEAGRSRDCAWSHPFFALPPGGKPRMRGGDTLYIHPGHYQMGLSELSRRWCDPSAPWDCYNAAPPSGPSPDRPTRISGAGIDGQCRSKPQLWGSERAARVLNLEGSSHLEVDCLEITDRSDCIEFHCHGGGCEDEVVRCQRDAPPYGDWAGTGVYAADARQVTLRDLDVHGLAGRGFQVGRVRDWTLQRVRIIGNGWVGWDGDIGKDNSSNAGLMHFKAVEIAWNGCAERYPSREHFACWAQSAGGYGDGLGTAATHGDWLFEDVHVHHNTSDGLDLLYLRPPGSVRIVRLRAEANAGNQLKTYGPTDLADSTIIGNCDAFSASRNMRGGDHCRALGSAVHIGMRPNETVRLANNTIEGNGDCLVVVQGGDATTRVDFSGNRLNGAPMAMNPAKRACGFYAHESKAKVIAAGNLMVGVR